MLLNSHIKEEYQGLLRECLVYLQSSESAALSFEVAVLLSKLKLHEERSIARLHKALHELSPTSQSLVSVFIRYMVNLKSALA